MTENRFSIAFKFLSAHKGHIISKFFFGSFIAAALAIAGLGATAIHDVTRGALLENLMEIAYLSGVGMAVDASRLPIRPVVACFAQTFQFDPLRMISSGTLAATVPPDRVKDVRNALTRIGVHLSAGGQVSDDAGMRLLRKEDTKH